MLERFKVMEYQSCFWLASWLLVSLETAEAAFSTLSLMVRTLGFGGRGKSRAGDQTTCFSSPFRRTVICLRVRLERPLADFVEVAAILASFEKRRAPKSVAGNSRALSISD